MDAADLAILETYADSMNDVEKKLLEEVRRLFDEVERLEPFEDRVVELGRELSDANEQLEAANEEIEELGRQIEALEEERDHALGRVTAAENALDDLKAAVRGLVG